MARIQEDRPITIKDDKGNTSKSIADIVMVLFTFSDFYLYKTVYVITRYTVYCLLAVYHNHGQVEVKHTCHG